MLFSEENESWDSGWRWVLNGETTPVARLHWWTTGVGVRVLATRCWKQPKHGHCVCSQWFTCAWKVASKPRCCDSQPDQMQKAWTPYCHHALSHVNGNTKLWTIQLLLEAEAPHKDAEEIGVLNRRRPCMQAATQRGHLDGVASCLKLEPARINFAFNQIRGNAQLHLAAEYRKSRCC